MSLADTVKRDFPPVFVDSEIVARNRIPAQPPSDGETSVFALKSEERRVFARDFAGPSNWVVVTKITGHGKIGIAVLGQADLLGRARVAATTSHEHGCDRLSLISKDQTMRQRRGIGCRAIGSRRLAHKLAMGKIAKTEIGVPPTARDKIRAADDGLRFKPFHRRAWSCLRLNYGSDGGFQVHNDDWDQFAVLRFQLKDTLVIPFDFSGNRDDEAGELLIAAGGADFPCEDFPAAAAQKQVVPGGAHSKEIASRPLLQKNPLIGSRNEQLARLIGCKSELLGMKNPENADANGAVL